MRIRASLLILFCAGLAFSQSQGPDVPPLTQTPADTTSNPVTLASQYFESGRNFLNYTALVNGMIDTNPFGNSTSAGTGVGIGIDLGGTVQGVRRLKNGSLALSYAIDYRNSNSQFYPSGTNQNLSFAYSKMLSRRWSFNFGQSAGIFLYGGTFYALQPSQTNMVQNNPFSDTTKFLSSTVSLSYQKSVRMSFIFTGNFFLSRYNYPGSIGTTGFSGTGAMVYRVSRRTSLTGTYSYSTYTYQQHVGDSQVNSVYLTISHQFARAWMAGVSGGFSEVHSAGTYIIPVTINNSGQNFTGVVTGPYDTTSVVPYFQATISRSLHRSTLSVTGGQTVTPGNGFYLTSRNLGLSGVYSYALDRLSSLNFAGYFSRLSTLSNVTGGSYSSTTFTASYSRVLLRHLGSEFRYDYVQYGSLGSYQGNKDNRFTFGIFFSSKGIPQTLF